MKKTLSLLLVAILVVGMFGGCSSDKAEETTTDTAKTEEKTEEKVEEKTYEIKMGHVLATEHPVHIAMVELSEAVSKRTNGNVDIQVYPNGELSSYKDGPEAILSGAAYMFFSSPGQFSDYVPGFVALQAPFLYDGFEHYAKLQDTDVIKGLKEESEGKGIHVLSLNFVSGFRNLLTDYEVTSVEDINNLKIRVPGNPVFTVPFELMGTNPSAIAWGETYTSLQQGVVDAIEGTSNNIYNAKMFEVKNVVTETGHILDLSGLFISADYWSTLPQEYRDIIAEEVLNAEKTQNTLAEQAEIDYKEILIAEGVAYNTVDKSSFKEATKSIILGFEIGQAMLDALEDVKQ